jgi:SAM-dependent methyltransferase
MHESAPTTQIPESGPPIHRRVLRRIKSAFLQFELTYRLYLKIKYGTDCDSLSLAGVIGGLPNRVLQSDAEWRDATSKAIQLHLPRHRANEKNWDHLAAVYAIAGATEKSARILDAGAELYSNVLPALFACGYRNLYGINLSFVDRARRGPIRYLPGDITRTEFPDCFFDAVTCMSVIEHGVPIEAYFREMFRILRPGGILITSTDYYPEPIDTAGKIAHGAPIKIFSKAEVEKMLDLAYACGLKPTAKIDLDCAGRPLHWGQFNLDFTFIIFTLLRP